MKSKAAHQPGEGLRPTPLGVGGLKSPPYAAAAALGASHPARGGWIEIKAGDFNGLRPFGPTPLGVGELKFALALHQQAVGKVPPRSGWVD